MSRAEKAREGRRAVSHKAWVVVGLVVFIAVDILLVALALGWGRGVPQVVGREASSETTSQTEDDPKESLVDPPPAPEPEAPQAAPRLLSVVSETVAWRSEGGTCDERSEIELTVDGGETWGSAYPAAEGLGRPLWLSGADYTAVQAAIASGQDCLAEGVRTYDSGASWMREEQVVANSVFIDPLDSSVMVWGGEPIEGPCEAITQVAVTGGVASVVCRDGTVWNLGSNSDSWDDTEVDGAFALSGSDGRRIAAVESDECDGLGLVEIGNESVQSIACTTVQPDEPTAVDLEGSTLWIWGGDQVSVYANYGGDPNP